MDMVHEEVRPQANQYVVKRQKSSQAPQPWRVLTDAFARCGVCEEDFAYVATRPDILRALALVIVQRTTGVQNPELFGEAYVLMIQNRFPESLSNNDTRRRFVRGLLYAGCSLEQLKLVEMNEGILRELSLLIRFHSKKSGSTKKYQHSAWHLKPFLYSVAGTPQEAGQMILEKLRHERLLDADVISLFQSDEVRWQRRQARTMAMVLSRNFITDKEKQLTLPFRTIHEAIRERFPSFHQDETDPSLVCGFLESRRRLEAFAQRQGIKWIRILHKFLVDKKNVASVTELNFNNGVLRLVRAVDGFENPQFDGNGAFAILIE